MNRVRCWPESNREYYNREPRSPQPRTTVLPTANHVRPNHYEPPMNQKNLSAILPVETGTANHVRGCKPKIQRQTRPLVPQNFSVQVKGKSKNLLPQQRRFATVARLIAAASELLQANPSLDYASRKEDLKRWAVDHGIEYGCDVVARMLRMHQPNLQRLIAQKRIPFPPLQRVGRLKVRLWAARDVVRAKKALRESRKGKRGKR
jgi:hypothetical protein